MNPSDLVQELGHRLKLTGLTLNNGACRLIFDGHIAVDLEDDGDGNLVLHTVLGPLPHENREAVLMRLVSSHLFGVETQGVCFGMHPKTHDVYLFRSLPLATLDVDAAMNVLEKFTQQSEIWMKRMPDLAQVTRAASADRFGMTELLRA